MGLQPVLLIYETPLVPPENAALLSKNLIRSHDAGIGSNMSPDITLKAMIIRAHTLAKGYSGFTFSSLTTLVEMINNKIIPLIPCTGSLGASGDLAYLARLGRAMMGDPVPVLYQGQVTSADEALRLCSIRPFDPTAKEGLALINGTTFMASMISIAYEKEMECINKYHRFNRSFSECNRRCRYSFLCFLAQRSLPKGAIMGS